MEWSRYWRSPDRPLEAMHAHFERHVYHRHSHETYSFGVTEDGHQAFRCRGGAHTSTAGMVIAFNPDDPHDGHAADELGFTYRMVHIGPELVADVLADITGRPGSVAVNAVQLGRYRRPRVLGRNRHEDDETPQPDQRLLPVPPRPLHVRVEADDTVVADFDRPVLQMTVANVLPSRGSTPLPPAADPADGYADVVISFAPGVVARARRLLRRGAQDGDKIVRVRARRVSVAGQRFWLRNDGVDGGAERRCTWRVAPRSLRMLVPTSSR